MKKTKTLKHEKAYIIELSSEGFYSKTTTPEELHNMKESGDGNFNYIRKCLYAGPTINSDKLVYVERPLCPHFRCTQKKVASHYGIASLPESLDHKNLSSGLNQTSAFSIRYNGKTIRLVRKQDLPALRKTTILGKYVIPDAHIYADYIIEGETYHELYIEIHNTSAVSAPKLKSLEIAQKPTFEFDLPVFDFDSKMSQQECITHIIELLESGKLILSGAFLGIKDRVKLKWTNNDWGLQAIYKEAANDILIYFFKYYNGIKIWYCCNNLIATRTSHLGKTIRTFDDARILAEYDVDEFVKGLRDLGFKPSSSYIQKKYNLTSSL